MSVNLTLALVGYVLLLVSTFGSLVVSWRTLRANERLQIKIDWLRQTLVTRDSTIRSYETGHFGEEDPDDTRTREIRPPPLPRT